MRQRVMIAIALACKPRLLFADEPTTALDVTVQAQVMQLLSELRHEMGMSMVIVTHDLGVVAGHTDRIAVMYAGEVVEIAPTRKLFANMQMPYTEALMN
jgi:ABC-type dipeptide/oligopeptide/nickel transport system ATPase component